MVMPGEVPKSLGEKVSQTLRNVFEPIIDLFIWPIEKGVRLGIEVLFDILGEKAGPILRPIIEAAEASGKIPPEIRPILDEIKQPTGELAALLGQSLAFTTMGSTLTSFLNPILLPISYWAQQKTRPVILPPNFLIVGNLRGIIGDTPFHEHMGMHGFSDGFADQMRDFSRPLIDEGTLRSLYFRLPILRPLIDQILGRHGYTSTDIGIMKNAWPVIPGPGDQVRFAVREAFDPAAIAKYGLGAFYPKLFEEQIAKVGVDPEWALRYWYSHWELPSTGAGYEMLHRGEIDKDTLLDLMRYADILPWWHDKLIAIAYSPYTRVDVRRMHALGVLDRAAVKRSYMDIGFDDDKAEKMTEFTIQYNQAANKELTRSDITDGYKRGLLAWGEAEDDLASLGYDAEEIEFYLTREDLKREEALKDDYSARYKKLYVKNLIDEAGLRAELLPLGFTEGEIGELITLWDIEKRSLKEVTLEEKERDLARTDVTDGYRRQMFSREEAGDLLDRLGYDAEEIGFYLTREDYRREEEQVNDYLTAYRKQYLKGYIDDTALKTALADAGVAAEQISHYLTLWGLDKKTEEWTSLAPVERDLTRTDVLDVFAKGIIPKEETEKMLAALGYDANEVELLIAKTLYGREKEKRQLTMSSYRQLYTTGILDKTSTTAALADLGFEAEEITLLYDLWDVEAALNMKIPTKAELTRFLKKGIINVATWRTLLAQMGYPDQVIAWYEEDMEE